MEKGDGGVGGRGGVTANPVFTVPFVFVFFFSEQRERFKCFRSNSQTASSFFFMRAWKHIESAFYRLDISISTSCKTFSWGGRERGRHDT